MSKRFRPYLPTAIALALYTILAIIMTWPLAGRLGTDVPGSIGDSFVHLWTFDWVRASLASGKSPFYTDLLFYPDGTTLIFHNFAWVNILAWLLMQLFVGDAAAYTLGHMGVLIFNGLASFLLARQVTGSDRASFVGGMIGAFWPFIISHQDHPNLIFIAWIPLALLYLKRTFLSGRVVDALLVALFLILTAITRWQLLIMAGPLVGLYILYAFTADRAVRSWHHVKLMLLIFFTTAVILLPLVAPLIFSQFTRSFPDDLFVSEVLNVTDLLAFVMPSRYHPLWGEEAFALSWQLAGNVNYVPFLGYTTIVLALLGSFRQWKKARFWLLAALVYAVLSLGPSLYVNGRSLPVPLPYALVQEWFVVKAIRYPERLNVIMAIPMAVLAALGVTALLRLPRLRGHKNVLTAGLCLLIALEYIVTFPTLSLETPDWYESIAAETGEFAVLDVPMNMRRMYDKQYMYYQTTHRRPLVEGHVSRPPRQAFAFIESIPFLRDIRDERMPPEEIDDISNQLQLLDSAGVRYLILHKQFLRDSHEAAWRRWLAMTPLYEDEQIIVYRTGSPALNEQFSLEMAMLNVQGQEQFGLVQAGYAPARAGPGSWVQTDLWWGSGAPLSEDYSLCLDLVPDDGPVIEAHCELISPQRPTSAWRPNELLRTRHLFQIQREWPRTAFQLVVVLKDEAGEPVGDSAFLGDFLIEAPAAEVVELEPSVESSAIWQDVIALRGYDQEMDGQQLDLILYWQALEDLNLSYKFFLHLIDPATGSLVAQVDYVPKSWTYPTDLWVEGEIIADEVTLPLADVPPGAYELMLGIYDPEDGQRLTVKDDSGENYPDRALPLFIVDR